MGDFEIGIVQHPDPKHLPDLPLPGAPSWARWNSTQPFDWKQQYPWRTSPLFAPALSQIHWSTSVYFTSTGYFKLWAHNKRSTEFGNFSLFYSRTSWEVSRLFFSCEESPTGDDSVWAERERAAMATKQEISMTWTWRDISHVNTAYWH